MPKCGNYHLSDLGFKAVKYGWITAAAVIFVVGLILLIVGQSQGNGGLSAGGAFTMIVGGIVGAMWTCWMCRCGCCGDEGCCQIERAPVYV